MENLLEEIKKEFILFEDEAGRQIGRGNASAGLRARNVSLKISTLLKQFRAESLDFGKKCKTDRLKAKHVA